MHQVFEGIDEQRPLAVQQRVDGVQTGDRGRRRRGPGSASLRRGASRGGSRRCRTAKSATQKVGIDTPSRLNTRRPPSTGRPRRTAANTPRLDTDDDRDDDGEQRQLDRGREVLAEVR